MSTCGDTVKITREGLDPSKPRDPKTDYRSIVCTLEKGHEEERHADGEYVWDHRCAWKNSEAPAPDRPRRRR